MDTYFDLAISLRQPAEGRYSADLALLLCDHHGASLIVTVGHTASIEEFFDRKRQQSNPSTFLTRMKVGEKLVDAKAVATLYRSRVSGAAIACVVLAALVAVIAAAACGGLSARDDQIDGRWAALDACVAHGIEEVAARHDVADQAREAGEVKRRQLAPVDEDAGIAVRRVRLQRAVAGREQRELQPVPEREHQQREPPPQRERHAWS